MLKNHHNAKLFVFAGANGSGKSSTRRSFSDGGIGFGVIIDTDEMARSINSGNPEKDNLKAAREAIKVAKDCIEKRISFCIETTLGGRGGAINHIREAKAAGYEVHMYYLGLDRVDTNIERVAIRVKNGGHNIPEETIRTRYVKSTEHLIEIIDLLDNLYIIDNSVINDNRTILIAKSGKLVWQYDAIPEWASSIVQHLNVT